MNIVKNIVAGLALALPAIMSAVPADPRVRTTTNPDGTVVEYLVHGNEYFHFMTDVNKTRILERDERGFMVDAMRDGKPLAFNQENLELLRGEVEMANPLLYQSASPMQRMATLDIEGRSNYPTIGKGTRSLVVLVEFEDMPFTVENPKEYFTRQLNEPGFSEYGGYGSALDYFEDVSNGKYTPQFDVYGPVKVSHDASYFYDPKEMNMNMNKLIKEALTTLHDAGEINFSNYDFDEDGVIDTVFIYYAGYGSADSDTETIWPHQFDYRYFGYGSTLKFDGKNVGPYACANELKGWDPNTGLQSWKDGSTPWVDGIGTFVHEYSHVLGLPDLYDTEYSGNVVTPGKWDVMDQGSYNFNGCRPPHYSAYEQWVCRWLDYTDAKDATHYELPSLGSGKEPQAVRIRIPKTADKKTFESEYFVIEARNKSNWDSCFPESGLLVWRINYNKIIWTNNTVNSKKGSNVEIVYAVDDKNPIFTSGNIYPEGPIELIPSKSYNYWKSPIISSISNDDESMIGSFDYNIISESPTGAPLLHDTPYVEKGTARNFTLTWDPVENADSYRVTIKRVSTGKPLGIYDEFDVGNVTSHKVVSVPISYWNNEIEIYVRTVKIIPCIDTSNVVRVVLKDIPRGENAVDGVEGDTVVIEGGIGCIHAPEGAVAFDLTGKRLPLEGLAPGIYVVSYGSKTKKVAVK